MITLLNKNKLLNWFEGLRIRTREDLKGVHRGIQWELARMSTSINSFDGKVDNIMTVYLYRNNEWTTHIILNRGERLIKSARPHIETYIDESYFTPEQSSRDLAEK